MHLTAASADLGARVTVALSGPDHGARATPRPGGSRRGETIPWRAIAARSHRAAAAARADPMEPALANQEHPVRCSPPRLSALAAQRVQSTLGGTTQNHEEITARGLSLQPDQAFCESVLPDAGTMLSEKSELALPGIHAGQCRTMQSRAPASGPQSN
jgi:hypothetical protein